MLGMLQFHVRLPSPFSRTHIWLTQACTKEHCTPRRALGKHWSLRDGTWGEESSWVKTRFVQTACCMVLINILNTFQKPDRIFWGVMYLLCISFTLGTVLNDPVWRFSYMALSRSFSLLSLEPKALWSRVHERSSRYHSANHTFGSD